VKKHIIFIQCMIDYLNFIVSFPSPLLIVWSTHFYLNFNWHSISRLCTCTLFLLQLQVFFYMHNNYSQAFCSNWGFFTGNIIFFPGTSPVFIKFKEISRTWKMNLLYSRMGGNPEYNNCITICFLHLFYFYTMYSEKHGHINTNLHLSLSYHWHIHTLLYSCYSWSI